MARSRFGIAIVLPSPICHEVDGIRRAIGSPQLSRIEPHVTIFPPFNLADDEIAPLLYQLRLLASRLEAFEVELWLY